MLRNPDSAEDAANKQYVDAGDAAVDNKLSKLKTDYEAHVAQYDKHVEDFKNNWKKFQKLVKTAEEFFGEPRVVDKKLAAINKSLTVIDNRLGVVRESKSFSDLIAGLQVLIDTINKRLKDAEAAVPQIFTKFNLIKISAGVAPENIVNLSYVVLAENAAWTPQNKTIKYTATATGIYRLTVISATQFTVGTTSMLRVTTGDNTSTGIVSVVLNSGANETFTLTPVVNGGLDMAPYHYCLEFVAKTSQLVTA